MAVGGRDQFLSKDGDSEVIYLWRERALRRSEAVPVVAGEQKMADLPRKRKFVIFLCRIGTNIDTERESQELRDFLKDRYGDSIHYEPYTRPETKHFTIELESMQWARWARAE